MIKRDLSWNCSKILSVNLQHDNRPRDSYMRAFNYLVIDTFKFATLLIGDA